MTDPVSPEIGRLALLAFLRTRSPLGPLKVMAAQVGRFFRIPIPGFRPYVVFGPQAARQVLITERQKILWRNTDPVTDLLGRGVLVVDGEEHDHYRALMEVALQPGALADYIGLMQSHTDRVTSGWRDGQTVDMLVESRKIALLIIMDALFGVDVWSDLPVLWVPIRKAIQFISPGAWILWRRIPRPGYRKPIQQLDRYLFGIIAERRKCGSEKHDLLQHLIDAGLSDAVIRDQMLTMLIAGHDTSTALLAWTFAMLGQHAELLGRLVDEIDTVEKPPLLDQVIKETLRLYPPIHIGNRIVKEELDFNGNRIPAGERLFYSIYLTHRDPTIWKNADQFCPERFQHGRSTPPLSYIPFGGGPRACIGAAFGQTETRLVLKRLLQGFHFEPVNTQVHAHMGATLEPRPGVLMRVTRRRPAARDVF